MRVDVIRKAVSHEEVSPVHFASAMACLNFPIFPWLNLSAANW